MYDSRPLLIFTISRVGSMIYLLKQNICGRFLRDSNNIIGTLLSFIVFVVKLLCFVCDVRTICFRTKAELLCYYRTEQDPLSVSFSQVQNNLIHSVEQKVSRKVRYENSIAVSKSYQRKVFDYSRNVVFSLVKVRSQL